MFLFSMAECDSSEVAVVVARSEAGPLGMQAARVRSPRPAHSFVETWS